MKIWFLSHTYLPAIGGIENYLREAGKALLDKGYRPTVICRAHDRSLPREEEMDGIRVIRHPDFRVPRRKLFSKHTYLADRIAAWLRENHYCRDGWTICRYPHYQYALSALNLDSRSIYLPASVWPALAPLAVSAGNIKERLFARAWRGQVANLEKKALNQADRIVVFSRNMRTQLEGYYGVKPENIIINPPGIDTDRFRPRAVDPEMLRRLNLKPDIPRLLFLGRFSPEKNLSWLLRAVLPLLEEEKAILLLAGDGPLRGSLENEIRRSRIGRAVKLLPGTDKPEMIYPLGDIFISPARYESFGQSILEAMATGLPVITLKNSPPGIRVAADEIIEEKKSGLTVSDTPEEFRSAVEYLLSSASRREELGNRGRSICKDRFTWERHVDELLRVMRSTGNSND